MPRMRVLTKTMLTRLGALLPRSVTKEFRRAADQIEVGRWMKAAGYAPSHMVSSREEVWKLVAAQVAHEKVLYLEFGVHEGGSILYWSKLLKHPEARLQGFDSFEGLPEYWHPDKPKKAFDVGGRIPVIDDARVEFFKGWFDQTLPGHVFPPHDRLVVNSDADLYSSTVVVLNALQPIIRVGSYLYFDEFDYPDHELRAFDEFLADAKMKFSLLASSPGFHGVAFQRVS
jgi:macrocin-O-methyltransferase TylF-like protien